MASPLLPVRQQLFLFLGGGPFEPLWDAVMDAASALDADASIPADDIDWYDELYDAVSMSCEDPVDRDDVKAGIIGAQELRGQLREMRLDQFATPPA